MLLCVPSPCCLGMTCCVSVLQPGMENSFKLLWPTKILYWQIVIQIVAWRNEAFIILLLLSLSLCFSLFPAHDCFWDLLDLNNFNEYSKVLPFCKYWIWAGDYETKQQEIHFSMRQQRICGSWRSDGEKYSITIWTTRKASIETLIILSATECSSETKPRGTRLSNFSASETMCSLFCSLLSNASSTKKKKKVTIIW